MGLIVPERVLIERENARKEQVVDEALGRAKEFFWRLQEIDPDLDLVLAHEGAHAEDERLLDGYWHIRRRNQGINDSYFPVTGPDGEWAEPSEYHLNQLRERDMWSTGAIDDIYKAQRKREARLKYEADRQRQEKLDELRLHYKSIDNPGVLFSDRSWSWRAGARRG